jgi:hypothetical protein
MSFLSYFLINRSDRKTSLFRDQWASWVDLPQMAGKM